MKWNKNNEIRKKKIICHKIQNSFHSNATFSKGTRWCNGVLVCCSRSNVNDSFCYEFSICTSSSQSDSFASSCSMHIKLQWTLNAFIINLCEIKLLFVSAWHLVCGSVCCRPSYSFQMCMSKYCIIEIRIVTIIFTLSIERCSVSRMKRYEEEQKLLEVKWKQTTEKESHCNGIIKGQNCQNSLSWYIDNDKKERQELRCSGGESTSSPSILSWMRMHATLTEALTRPKIQKVLNTERIARHYSRHNKTQNTLRKDVKIVFTILSVKFHL